MKAKGVVFIITILFIIIIIALGIMLQKQRKVDSAAAEEDADALELVGENGQVLPSGIPTVAETPNEEQQVQQAESKEEVTDAVQGQEMVIDTNNTYSAVLETTEGDITIAFHVNDTPITVNNFIALARKDFYDTTIFHRVIKGFMIQGGDPEGDGTGGPGYTFDDEDFTGDYTRGTVAMANAGPNTNGSQFFIMHEDSLSLPKDYVIFGEVTDGMDVVDAIADADVEQSSSGEMSKPIDPVKITNVKIIEE